jgi:Mn2+/Fe2+ NRAMP family transporter
MRITITRLVAVALFLSCALLIYLWADRRQLVAVLLWVVILLGVLLAILWRIDVRVAARSNEEL